MSELQKQQPFVVDMTGEWTHLTAGNIEWIFDVRLRSTRYKWIKIKISDNNHPY